MKKAKLVPTVRDIDIEHDQIIGIFEIGKYCPGPKKPSRSASWRWMGVGIQIPGTDERVKLPWVKLSGVRCTSVESLMAFLRVANGRPAEPAASPSQRRVSAVSAGKVLESAGA